ncbi:hypothetical protein B0T25DRAFT_333799 [Lasiosphaeria hispida]|uniref:Uncharacterized protein n=1 Tax=Lasiosphaeria hispida TaxID=260671 RepID=A0AAJ0H5T3_9PEZI|nr:hypothetical protein B0T25DRAFT_333799 [Lasiosphaeria hispida]
MSNTRLLALGNASAPSLRGAETATLHRQTPPASLRSPPPPAHVERYEKKPLPPLPPKRASLTSTLSKEMSQAFATPEGSVEFAAEQLGVGKKGGWEKEENEIAVILDRGPGNRLPPPSSRLPAAARRITQRTRRVKVETRDEDVPPDNLLSPQPRSSVQKILRLTSLKRVTSSSSSSPSGHNPGHKIKQLMGMDVGSEGHARRAAPKGPKDPHIDVSPLSNRSSLYSQDLDATISEPDSSGLDANYGSKGYSSNPSSGYSAQRFNPKGPGSGAAHSPLNSMNLANSDTASEGGSHVRAAGRIQEPPSADDFAPRTVNRDHWSSPRSDPSRYGHDLYHTTASQLARTIPSSSQRMPVRPPPQDSSPRWLLLDEEFTRTVDSLPSYHSGGGGATRPPSSPSYPSPLHQAPPLQDGLSGPARAETHPPLRSMRGESRLRATSASATAHWHYHHQQPRQQHYRHAQQSSDPTPTPRGMRFEYDSDSNSTSTSTKPRSKFHMRGVSEGEAPRIRPRRRSIISKVFKRGSSSAATTARMSTAPSTSATTGSTTVSSNYSANANQQSTSPTTTTFTHRSTDSEQHQSSPQSQSPDSPRSPRSPRTSLPPPFSLPAAMASMTSLAHRTGDMVEQVRLAAGLKTQSEKRRESLKSKIVVLGDGGQIIWGGEGGASHSPGVEGDGETSGSVSMPVSRTGSRLGQAGTLQGGGPWI